MSLVILLALLHDEKVVTADLRFQGSRLELRLHVGMERIAKGVALPADRLDLTELQLAAAKDAIARYLVGRMRVGVDGLPQTPVLESLEPRFEKILGTGEEIIASVVATLHVPALTTVGTVTFSYDAFTDFPGSKVLVSAHNGEAWRTYVRNGPDPLDIRWSSIDPSFLATAGEFLVWGMRHIFGGFDHIAFLLALLLGASKAGEMVKIVTSFTVAHSLTLLLAATNVLVVERRITEALIAASIVYVAVENYFVKDAAYRWVLTFGFGLVHGLGFAGELRERLSELKSIAVPVLSFNLGVELGQLAILAVVFPLLAGIRRREKARVWTLRLGSAVLLLFGAGWLVERVFQLGFMPL